MTPKASAGRAICQGLVPVARSTVSSLSLLSRLVTQTEAPKAAIGSTMRIRFGSVRAVNSRNTSADWPLPISVSNSTTARLTQNTATRISAKKPKKSRYCDSTYLS